MTGASVLHLCPSAAWGGAEQVADTLRAEAGRAGWNASLDLPFPLADRAAPTPTGWWRFALRRRAPVDVVHAHLPWPDRLGAALLAARSRPLVVTFHLLPPRGRWPRDRLFRVASERALRVASRLRPDARWVALSRADRERLEALLDAPVTVVRNAPPEPACPPAPLPWPDGALRLLTVGRLDFQKGYDRLLRALAHPSLRALPWHWSLLGDGPERASLSALAASLGLSDRVRFHGTRPAIDGLSGADLLLCPSRYEGMPLVPLEAAEAGVPVLASAIDAHRELYESAPGSLLPEDEGSWPAALARGIGDPAVRSRVHLAQRAVLGQNPRRATFAAYESLYREAMATSR